MKEIIVAKKKGNLYLFTKEEIEKIEEDIKKSLKGKERREVLRIFFSRLFEIKTISRKVKLPELKEL